MNDKRELERVISKFKYYYIVVDIDTNFPCGEHYNSFTHSNKFVDPDCPTCQGFGYKNTAFATKGRIDNYAAITQYDNNFTPGNMQTTNWLGDFPLITGIQGGDLIVETDVTVRSGLYYLGEIRHIFEVISVEYPRTTDYTLIHCVLKELDSDNLTSKKALIRNYPSVSYKGV